MSAQPPPESKCSSVFYRRSEERRSTDCSGEPGVPGKGLTILPGSFLFYVREKATEVSWRAQ
jgi:hypothetical protein